MNRNLRRLKQALESNLNALPSAAVFAAATLALLFASPASAQDDSTIAERFAECYALETGEELDSATADALAEQANELAETLGIECEEEDCPEILELECDELAGGLAAPLGVDLAEFTLEEAPPWAVEFVAAIIGRVEACYEIETGEEVPDESLTALEGYQETLAAMLGSTITQAQCEPNVESLLGCTGAIGAIDCSDLAAGLESGVNDLMGDSGDDCSELFGCGTEDDLEALFDNERVGSSGD